MVYEKKKIFLRRVISLILFILGTIVTSIFLSSDNYKFENIGFMVLYANAFVFVFLVWSLMLSCKVYDYNGVEIIVYAGWFHNYIKVNGIVMDEHNTFQRWTAIILSCTLEDSTDLKVTISLFRRIALKINNKLYRETK